MFQRDNCNRTRGEHTENQQRLLLAECDSGIASHHQNSKPDGRNLNPLLLHSTKSSEKPSLIEQLGILYQKQVTWHRY